MGMNLIDATAAGKPPAPPPTLKAWRKRLYRAKDNLAQRSGLRGTALAAGLWICDLVGARDSVARGYAAVSAAGIAEKFGVHLRAAEKIVAALRQCGWFDVEGGHGRGRGVANRWRLKALPAWAAPADGDRVEEDDEEAQPSEAQCRAFALNRLAAFVHANPYHAPNLPWREIVSAPSEHLQRFFAILREEREKVFGRKDDKSALPEARMAELWRAIQPEPAAPPAVAERGKADLLAGVLKAFGTDQGGVLDALGELGLSPRDFAAASSATLGTFLAKVTAAEVAGGGLPPRERVARLWASTAPNPLS